MAPLIATLLSHGLSLVANAALAKGKDYIKEKTGVDLDKTTLNQEDFLALKKYEMEHEAELLRLRLQDDRLGLEEKKLLLQDVADARARETQITTSAEAPLIVKITPSILALGTIALIFLFFILFVYISTENPQNQLVKEIMLYVLGVLSAIATQIIGYYFGSSRGSAQKSETIDTILSKQEGE